MAENKEDPNPLFAHYSFDNTPEHPGWNLKVKKVLVVLSGSRSGSSLLKSVLEKHKDIASLDGEIDPYLSLSGNGYPYTSQSDAISKLANTEMLLNNLFRNLGAQTSERDTPHHIKDRVLKRFVIQFPELFLTNHPELSPGRKNYPVVVERIDKALAKIASEHITDEKTIAGIILTETFPPYLRQFFDGYKDCADGQEKAPPFSTAMKIEEPPFVFPSPYKRPFTEKDAATKTLLFKSPQDAYRPGMYEQLFPNAEIKYVHLTRGCIETVNGLMDGWLSPVGFFSHNIERRTGEALNIGGYSDTTGFGKSWWKFDLPYNWKEFADKPLEEVCLNQWKCAQEAILGNKKVSLRVKFEDFLKNPQTITDRIFETAGLPKMPVGALPVVMATKPPDPLRWRNREQILLPLLQRPKVAALMQDLGYGKAADRSMV